MSAWGGTRGQVPRPTLPSYFSIKNREFNNMKKQHLYKYAVAAFFFEGAWHSPNIVEYRLFLC
ncbi:hypothetical protein D8M06_16230 [Oceanobacillus halophilus]|uniref:Uncharacterized protein n=1 Tax=Oceanobacillus halophilus TaxID=930130 RepID=A0A494ZUZ9_9BACI|nr:hypothetical protein D8M06_16230 [Oceanobacillus halophilus]